jgi:glyoxylase-like metal-dependent hydrolase (beta-lactamase superfamily II)
MTLASAAAAAAAPAPDRILDYPIKTPPVPGEAIAVAPGIRWLRMALPFALDHINLWLLEDGDAWTIVDCGIGNEPTRAHWQQVFDRYLGGKPVRRVICTHCHPDHAGNADWLTRRWQAEFWMAQGEYMAAHAYRDERSGFDPEAIIEMYRQNGLAGERLAKMRERRGGYSKGVPEFPHRYHRLMEGMPISIGGRSWRMIMGYGHSPEHTALYCDELQVLISGDMVLPRISTNVSVAVIDPEGNPLKLFLDSLARYLELPAGTLTLPSHGLPFRGLHQRIGQLREHHALRLAELHAVCDTPRAAVDVLSTLFRRELDVHQLSFAMGEAMAHLHFLQYDGQLARQAGTDDVIRFMRA